MDNLQQNLPHMIMGTVAIVAVTVLACLHLVSGGEALGIIGAAAGFTMGVGGSSVSSSGVVGSLPAASLSPGQTVTETVAHTVAAAPVNPTAPVPPIS